MALIECPDCYNQISDRARACPYCGSPMRDDDPAPRRESREVVRYQDRAPARKRREVVEVVHYVDDDEDGDFYEDDPPARLPAKRRGMQPQNTARKSQPTTTTQPRLSTPKNLSATTRFGARSRDKRAFAQRFCGGWWGSLSLAF